MASRFLETLLNADSPSARSERPVEFPRPAAIGFRRDALAGRREDPLARRRLPDRGRTYASSASDFGAGEGQVHGASGSDRRRLRTAQRLARYPRSRRPEPAALGRARHSGFHGSRAAARRPRQRTLPPRSPSNTKASSKPPTTARFPASNSPMLATIPATCSTPDAGSR